MFLHKKCINPVFHLDLCISIYIYMQPIWFTILYQIKITLDELVEMIKEYTILGFPFTSQEIRTIAYEFA